MHGLTQSLRPFVSRLRLGALFVVCMMAVAAHSSEAWAETAERSVELTFVVDHSGSTTTDDLDRMRRTIEATIAAMKNEDQVAVVLYATRASLWRSTSTPIADLDVSELSRFLASRSLSGGSNLMEALTKAASRELPKNAGGLVVVFTDGRASIGERDHDVIQKKIRELNAGRRAFAFLNPSTKTDAAMSREIATSIARLRTAPEPAPEATDAETEPSPASGSESNLTPDMSAIWSNVFASRPAPLPGPRPAHPDSRTLWDDGGRGPLATWQIAHLEMALREASSIRVQDTTSFARRIAPGWVIYPDVVVTVFDWTRFDRCARAFGANRPGLSNLGSEIIVRVNRITYMIRLEGC